MIYKSYLIEKNIKSIKENVILFYGENYGIKKDFKEKIRNTNKNSEFLLFDQKNILENSSILYNEVYNNSLFKKNKILFLENVNDRVLDVIQDIHLNLDNQKIYLFSDILEKKSKLRNFFEKSKECAIIPCYIDNEVTIKNLILEKLKGYDGLTAYNINLILNHVTLDRIKLNNEIEKIIAYFIDKKIKTRELSILLDVNLIDDFNFLKDEALSGNKEKTNDLLSNTILEDEKAIYYLTLINQRLNKLYQIKRSKDLNLETTINKFKPPIFWKDKPRLIIQANKWDEKRLKRVIEKTYNIEKMIKSNSFTNKQIILKELVVNLCEMASD
tara:strand:+ start:68 stop:1054 length:987 start_codon:yes stop_codon:yes gene_type:complete